MAFSRQGQKLQASLLVEVDESFAFHLLEDFDDVRVCAVDAFRKTARIDLTFGVAELDEHHCWFLSEKNVKDFLILHH